jgi:hypothetical protein
MLVGNVGGCRVPEDGACSADTTACGPGLTCLGGRCAQACSAADQCAASQTCGTVGTCARLPFEGPCDTLGGSCLEGQTCTPNGCESVAPGAATVGGSDLFAPCTEPTQCRDGLACATPRCLRTCQRDASGAARSSCGPGSYCGGSDTSGGPVLTGGAGYCTQPCDPTRFGVAAGCPEGFNCGVGIPNTSYSVCEPMAPMGGLRLEACRNQQCAAGLDCVNGVVAEQRCFAHCESDANCVGGTELCDLAFSHRVLDQNGAMRTVGVCRPRCGTVEECQTILNLPAGMVACTGGVCVRP